jgi:hypothetical protein
VNPVPKDFFVSYTATDEAWATWIAYALEEDGYAVAIQEWDFRPGNNFAVEMDKALRQCPRMIAVLSPAYLKAPFPASEWAAAFAGDPVGAKNALVPIMVEQCFPVGLLSQVVQIRIVGLDETAARKRILDGVRRERNKPSTPPPFPGSTGAALPAPAVPFPSATTSRASASSTRLRWQSPSPPVEVSWRRDLDRTMRGRQVAESIEVHLAFAGNDARLQVSDLGDLKDQLPDHGRQHGFFTRLEALDAHSDSDVALVTSSGWGNEKGLAVRRSGQRSAWAPLPRGPIGAVLDPDHLIGQVTRLLDTLAALDLCHGDLVVPTVGFDPATMISYGQVNTPRNSATFGHRQTDHIHVAPEEAIEYGALASRSADVATELVARLVADHRAGTGLR